MTIKPEELSSEERAIVDRFAMNIAQNNYANDWSIDYEKALAFASVAIRARRALFAAPAPTQERRSQDPNCGPSTHTWDYGYCLTCEMLGRKQDPPQEAAPVEWQTCPNCGLSVVNDTDHEYFNAGSNKMAWSCFDSAPAPAKVETGLELPEAVRTVTYYLRSHRKPDITTLADDLEKWARSLPAAPPEPKLDAMRALIVFARANAQYLTDTLDHGSLNYVRQMMHDKLDAALAELDALEAK